MCSWFGLVEVGIRTNGQFAQSDPSLNQTKPRSHFISISLSVNRECMVWVVPKLNELMFQSGRMVEVSLLLALAPWSVAAAAGPAHHHLPAYGPGRAEAAGDCGMEGGVWVAGLAAILVFYLLVVIVGAAATIAQKSKTGKGGATQEQVRWGAGFWGSRCWCTRCRCTRPGSAGDAGGSGPRAVRGRAHHGRHLGRRRLHQRLRAGAARQYDQLFFRRYFSKPLE